MSRVSIEDLQAAAEILRNYNDGDTRDHATDEPDETAQSAQAVAEWLDEQVETRLLTAQARRLGVPVAVVREAYDRLATDQLRTALSEAPEVESRSLAFERTKARYGRDNDAYSIELRRAGIRECRECHGSGDVTDESNGCGGCDGKGYIVLSPGEAT